ncbi:hypothetical protein LTR64_002403 [Lithohypha guttulata]|uniref:uncharacterized protein n=1 Tax=Lithohypha guttulata TaxID=1690604 RepID=UPI002DDFA1F4|nr:hypothetical protein LTR51_001372 [Lithohypha guttulata]
MVNFACRRPTVNHDLILNDGLPYLEFDNQNGGPSKKFGIALACRKPEMTLVNARLLPPPDVCFASKTEKFAEGKWNLRGKRFARSTKKDLLSLSYLALRRNGTPPCRNTDQFVKSINDGLKNYFNSSEVVKVIKNFAHDQALLEACSSDELAKRLEEAFKWLQHQRIKLVLIILPDNQVNTYYSIKKAADRLTGIHTVCIVRDAKGLVKTDPGTVGNLMLKINQKLGGVNWGLRADQVYADVIGKNAIFVGADVTHPGRAAMLNAPSIASVVATCDQDYFHYAGSVRLQASQDEEKKALEMIEDFHGMMVERLKLYQHKNQGRLPDRIFYIRDGVSDGQFQQVLDQELSQLKRACKQMYKDQPLPKLLVLTTQKRHHTRFFADQGDKSDSIDNNRNFRPGLVVDTQIVSKQHFDWYNTSHACIQGTSRPCKYVVLYDTIGVSADQIQMMMYHMAYTFGRATRSISIHPAARYADLLAERARLHFRSVYNPPPTPQGQKKPTCSVLGRHWTGSFHDDVKDTMFYI